MVGYSKTPVQLLEEGLKVISKENGNYKVSAAALLLFGKDTQRFFPRARIRFIKYQGTEEKTGAQMNIIKDVIFEGTVLQMLKKAIDFVGTQIKEFTRLTKGGLFATTPEYPEFVWNEIIVNAVAHRDYSIKGTDIHIKMFDDKIAVESPGTLPGLVRLNNMRKVHFSRNPKIAGFLKDYKYVKEFGEGVDRMYNEMAELGLPEPQYSTIAFMTKVVVKNDFLKSNDTEIGKGEPEKFTEKFTKAELNKTQKKILDEMLSNSRITHKQLSEILNVSERAVKKNTEVLKEAGIIERIGPAKGGYWKVR